MRKRHIAVEFDVSVELRLCVVEAEVEEQKEKYHPD
jgi:hypothetical protein